MSQNSRMNVAIALCHVEFKNMDTFASYDCFNNQLGKGIQIQHDRVPYQHSFYYFVTYLVLYKGIYLYS